MPSDRMFELLADALSKPSSAYRAAEAGLGAINQGIEGYKSGMSLADEIQKRKMAKQTLADILGPNLKPELQPYANLPSSQFENTAKFLTGAGAIEKATKVENKMPSSMDAYLTREVLNGKMSAQDAFDMKNSGLLLRSGYVQGPGKSIAPVPGGKPARDIAEENAKKEMAKRASNETAKTVISTIDDVLPRVGFMTTGLVGATTKHIGGTPAADLDAALNTVRSNVGFETLQTMRQNSPTGGALGQISDRENTLLQSTRGSLEQKQNPDQLAKTLKSLRDHYANVILINESQTGDPEADNAIAQVISSGISDGEKRARIQGIRSAAGR